MELNLNQAEIEEGIKLFIREEGFDLSDKEIEIKITSGKKPPGYRAAVTMRPAAQSELPLEGGYVSDEEEQGIPFGFKQQEDSE